MQVTERKNYFLDPRQLPKGVRIEQVEQVMEQEYARRQRQIESTQRAVESLRSNHRTLRNRILGPEEDERLRRAVQDYQRAGRQRSPATPISQQESAQENLVRLETEMQRRMDAPTLPAQKMKELKALNSTMVEECKAILESMPPISKGADLSAEGLAQMPKLDTQTENTAAPSASAIAVYRPPGYGWWGWLWLGEYVTGDGKTRRHDSYLWSEVGRTGSCVWAENYSASGYTDAIWLVRNNGFLLGYTAPQNGTLRLEIDIECSIAEHCIETWDEFGWSDYSAGTQEILTVGLLWNWEDPSLGIELNDQYFVSGLRGSGDGEKSPGLVYPVTGGSRFTLVKYINTSLYAGQGVYVYVGTEQRAWAALDDVSCNIFTNGSWFVTEVRVQSV
jgi:hypothetical protein